MKTTLKNLGAMLVLTSFLISCERTIDVGDKSATTKPAAANDAASNKCRLAYASYWNDFTTETYKYNSAGLVSECQVDIAGSLFIHATMQYDSKGRLTTGTISYDDITFYDVVFVYENNRIVKEMVYEPGTTIIADYTLITYNQQGQIVRRTSPLYNLYANFKYDAVGNLIDDEVLDYDNDLFVFGIKYHYDSQIKEPKKARPGLPSYSWWWLDEMTSNFLATEREDFAGDGIGGSFQVYDEDPAQTVISTSAQNLANDRLSFDDFTVANFFCYWEYENCGGKNESVGTSPKRSTKISQQLQDRILLNMPLLKGPGLKKQLAERKAILERLKISG